MCIRDRSLAETALFSAVMALLLLHLSGVFRTPLPDSSWALVEALSPFQALHDMFLGVASFGTRGETLLGLFIWMLTLPALTVWLASPIASSLGTATEA